MTKFLQWKRRDDFLGDKFPERSDDANIKLLVEKRRGPLVLGHSRPITVLADNVEVGVGGVSSSRQWLVTRADFQL